MMIMGNKYSLPENIKNYLSRCSFRQILTASLLSIILILTVIYLIAVYPLTAELENLKKEKVKISEEINAYRVKLKKEAAEIPYSSKLPTIADYLKTYFEEHSVKVDELVQARVQENSQLKEVTLILNLRGTWQDILETLDYLEKSGEHPVNIQEVDLNSGGGQVLVEVFFGNKI